MVLRDKRDKGKKLALSNRWDEMKYGYDRSSRNKRLRRMHSKKNRIKFKKYTNNVVVFNSKQKHIKKEKFKSKKDVCSICCESTKNIEYINCKRGGIQSVNFGKYGECCKDKPICSECRIKCSNCPFCKAHTLHNLKNRFPQKKPSFAVRQERIRLKKLKKEALAKKRKLKLRLSVRRSERYINNSVQYGFRRITHQTDLSIW